jgi:ketosteroid isomerase-like protein
VKNRHATRATRTTFSLLGTGLLVLIGTSACSSDTSVGAPPVAPVDWHAFDLPRKADAVAPGPTAKERAAGDAYIAALATPGMPALGPALDADSHFTFPGMSDARGKDGVLKGHDALFGAFDSRVFTPTRLWRTDSTLTIEWTMSGTQARDWMGVAATHKSVVFKGVSLLWTRDEGSITDVHVVFDVTAVKTQLGAGPKELAALTAPAMPTGAAQSTEQTHSPDETANVATVHTWLDALEHADDAAYVAAMSDDVAVDAPERPQPMHGKDDERAYFRAMHHAIGELDTRVDNAWGFGHFAVVEYSINGEQVGPLGWIPAKADRVVRLHVVDIIDIQGGKIAHITRYENPGEIIATG